MKAKCMITPQALLFQAVGYTRGSVTVLASALANRYNDHSFPDVTLCYHSCRMSTTK